MKYTETGLAILIVIVIWWGVSTANGSSYYQLDIPGIDFFTYDKYTLAEAFQAILALVMIGCFILGRKK